MIGHRAGHIPADLLLEAYRNGIFPMVEEGEIQWHCPDPRAVFDLASLRPDAATARALRSGRFRITLDQDFEGVMRGCASREETWIDERLIASYAGLHRLGYARSVEVWTGEELAGGIYGVALGAAFFGESMFGMDNAGKVAFHSLAAHLRQHGFLLFDTQYINPFTRRLGAFELPRTEFMYALRTALASDARY